MPENYFCENKDIQNWIKRSNRKKARLLESKDGSYTIIYFDKGKARIGAVGDGMACRYGIRCYGSMNEPDVMYLWQEGPGAVSVKEVNAMIDYLNGNSQLPEFDFSVLKNLRH